MQKIKLDCDACGAPLLDAERPGFYKCPYCGRSYMIEGNLGPKPVLPKKQSRSAQDRLPDTPEDRQTAPIREELVGEIKELLSKGLKIQAIKLYKDNTGAGLKDSKDFVDKIERTMRI